MYIHIFNLHTIFHHQDSDAAASAEFASPHSCEGNPAHPNDANQRPALASNQAAH